MKRFLLFLAVFVLAACTEQEQASVPAGNAMTGAPAPHSDLAQLMRGFLYPNSEIIFAAQSEDPDEAAAAAAANLGPFDPEPRYTGWEGVENAALMLSEAANLIVIPGRYCENGLPVPLEDEDYRTYAAALVDAGQAAYEAALTRDLDAMVDVSGVVADACAFCHDIFRDKPEGEMRCVRD